MALGGMRDHIGGGFHRYSVDAEWRVPHFEKMLYDQAQLVLAYLEAAQATGEDFFATVAEDTLDYVSRDSRDAGGGFYSAEDADSVPPEQAGQPGAHKKEGAFYVWCDEEIGALLGADAIRRSPALRHRAERQRATRSARGVHRPEPALCIARHSTRWRPNRSARRRGHGRARAVRGRFCSTRAADARARTWTTRSSPRGTE